MSIRFSRFATFRGLTSATILLGAFGLIDGPAEALTYTYTNATSGAVSFSAAAAGAAGCATPLVRTFSVSDSFSVSRVGLGFNIDHANRGDVRLTLVSPSGTALQLIAGTAGGGGDTQDNFDILLSSNTEGTLADTDVDPTAAPFFNRIVPVANIDTAFSGVASSGTWTLNICDINNNATNGTFNRAYLTLVSTAAATSVCTGTVTYDWGANGSVVPFTNATVGDLTITQGATSDFAGTGATAAGTLGNGVLTRTTINGNHTGYYSLSMDAAAAAGTQDNEGVGLVSTLSFSRPVRDLRFTFLDVDITGGSWEDQIEVVGTGPSGNRVPYTIAAVAGGNAQLAGDLAEGDASAAQNTTTGNLDVAFTGAVSSITLNYTQGDDPANENQFMVVGISDFVFCGYDYGDAPNSYGTLLAGGARHAIGDRTLYLGTNPPDGEADGQAGAAATTDDTTQVGGVDDEDGLASFPAYASPSTSYTVSVTAVNLSTTTAGSLVGYIDWNRDGDFLDANEISGTVTVPANTSTPTAFNVTWSAVPSNAGGTTATYARFRTSYTAAEVTTPVGVATSGEVEDYQIPVSTLPVSVASFSAARTTRGIEVEWTTETETSTVGYALLGRKGPKDAWQPLTPKLLPARSLDRLAPQSYRRVLPDGGWTELLLEDAGLDGGRTRHGPFALDRPYGRPSAAEPIDWATVHAEIAASAEDDRRAQSRVASVPAAELRVDADGLYRVTYEELRAAGIDFAGANLARLSLTAARTGKEVPIYVEGGEKGSEIFGPGSFVEFRGEAVAGSLYTRSRVYRLAVGRRPSRVLVEDGTPQGASVASYGEVLAIDRDLVYSFASPNGDPWYEAPVLAQGRPTAKSFPIEVDAPASTEARLHVDLWGVTNWPSTPDHHLQISLDGTQLVDERFDGLTAKSYDLPLPPGLLFEGTNTLEVRLPGDTGNAFDLVHVDRYAVSYPRRFVARNDRLSFPGAPGRIEVEGLGANDLVVYAKGGASRLSNVAIDNFGGGFRAAFSIPGAATKVGAVDLSTASAMLHPAIQPAREAPADLGNRRADYLIVTHPSLAGELAPLIAARESEGHRVKLVDVLDLYAAYSGGEIDPQAIRDYVRYAAQQLGARYLLLVGADTYDYFDHLGIGSVSLIPTPYAQTDDLIRFTPADSVYGDLDGDGVQDLALGRFPARTASELRQLIAKTLAFDGSRTGALFAADAADGTEAEVARTFSSISDQLISQVPAAWPLVRAYVDDLGAAAARSQLIAAFDQGPALVHYVGHSGPTVWSFRGLFSAADGAALNNVGSPSLVVQWGCWNTYHVAPEVDTLAHRLLLAGPQGAAAVIGSATLSRTESDQLLGPALLARLMVPGTTIGDALLQAKRTIAAIAGGPSDLRDALLGWTLLGDPAMKLRP
ncbi:MAG: C25 family cysteine peptidase [Acidobacteriota bacterium]